jgi:hypothetical protein
MTLMKVGQNDDLAGLRVSATAYLRRLAVRAAEFGPEADWATKANISMTMRVSRCIRTRIGHWVRIH